jgi:hypothetical protein
MLLRTDAAYSYRRMMRLTPAVGRVRVSIAPTTATMEGLATNQWSSEWNNHDLHILEGLQSYGISVSIHAKTT